MKIFKYAKSDYEVQATALIDKLVAKGALTASDASEIKKVKKL
jgi:polyhydroxyalkanoate synthesis regulator phasin